MKWINVILILVIVMMGLGRGQQHGVDEYYYRHEEYQEGIYGVLIRLRIINQDSLDKYISTIEYRLEGYPEWYMYVHNVPSPPGSSYPTSDVKVTNKWSDWQYFEEFSGAVLRLPIAKGYIREDSVYFYGARVVDPQQLAILGYDSLHTDIFDFAGALTEEGIVGKLVVHYAFELYDTLGSVVDTIYESPYEDAIFKKRPKDED